MLEKNIADVIAFIEKNIELKLSIDLISKISGYSRRYTELLFKRHTGLSLGKYIKRRKLTRAAYLLRYTTSRVIDITFRLNFDSPQSFSREFKKMFGKSPVAFRNSEIWDISLMLPPLTLKGRTGFFLEIITLKPEIIHGYYISYIEQLPFDRNDSIYRWNIIGKEFSVKKIPFRVFSVFAPDSLNDTQLRVQALIESTQQSRSGSRFNFDGGLYASYYFKGTVKEYADFVVFIYSKGINKTYHLRNNACLIESIKQYKNEIDVPMIACVFYIPVVRIIS